MPEDIVRGAVNLRRAEYLVKFTRYSTVYRQTGRQKMRVPKRRYRNDLQRYALAARMVVHEVRTETIRRWSGLSEGRVRQLYRAYARERDDQRTVRHRGPAPNRPTFFLRSAQNRHDAGALAALCSALGAIPPQPVPNARRELPSVQRGELLCRAYELFRDLVGSTTITLEHTLLLAVAISQGTELKLGNCSECGGALIYQPYASAQIPPCKFCRTSAPADMHLGASTEIQHVT